MMFDLQLASAVWRSTLEFAFGITKEAAAHRGNTSRENEKLHHRTASLMASVAVRSVFVCLFCPSVFFAAFILVLLRINAADNCRICSRVALEGQSWRENRWPDLFAILVRWIDMLFFLRNETIVSCFPVNLLWSEQIQISIHHPSFEQRHYRPYNPWSSSTYIISHFSLVENNRKFQFQYSAR